LLEVGTGFHGELSGRENVYLNGAILGMKRADIDRRFDAIVEFAEMARFLDTPVKRYSSGMTVRLAFAVAAHLEPEILLVDEVLAVGDVSFQRKCIGKMSEVAGEGRTVLFVSHNMAIMQALCQRGLFLERGKVRLDGSIADAVSAYLRDVEEAATLNLLDRTDRRGWGEVRLAGVTIEGEEGELLATGRRARFCLTTKPIYDEAHRRLACTLSIVNSLGQVVTTLTTGPLGYDDELEKIFDTVNIALQYGKLPNTGIAFWSDYQTSLHKAAVGGLPTNTNPGSNSTSDVYIEMGRLQDGLLARGRYLRYRLIGGYFTTDGTKIPWHRILGIRMSGSVVGRVIDGDVATSHWNPALP
jgi:energy-coupling factor transporter ATP-binding protein EcfA2